MVEEVHYIFFLGEFDNYYNSYLPTDYIGERLPFIHLNENQKILSAYNDYKNAILEFMRVFPQANNREKDMFMRFGYPWLKIKIVELLE